MPSKILENLINNDDCNVILLELDDGKYLSVFNAYVQRGTFGMRLDDGSLMDNNSEIVLVSSSAIEGNKFFALSDKFKEFHFEITDGYELIGLTHMI